ncbi:hypothetical protein CLV30_10554 [Haloactinopolyspora alba]|uniref:Uncharacterized protein n=1 Tax=Haloactinopolyspora alba TaxID=648780 RepID=A0A2P8E551_9ACTN|nr:hypothetical protein [Haloactinopolyspora alba]PSL04590.1 hypothetical protein CLV30_10554 [Haloactinopolyspora alba]
MRLLEEMPSTAAHRRPARRPGQTLAALSAFLVTATAGGVVLVTSGDGDDLTLEDWIASVSSVCARVAEEHPVMTEDTAARTHVGNVSAVGAATRALASAVRDLPVPNSDSAVTGAVIAGDRAQDAWDTLAGSATVGSGELTEAAELTAAFVAEVNSAGADCTSLS